jgi:hypothetical protein
MYRTPELHRLGDFPRDAQDRALVLNTEKPGEHNLVKVANLAFVNFAENVKERGSLHGHAEVPYSGLELIK